MSITLKIGRHSYEITERDEFMDNGKVVLLVSQSKEIPDRNQYPHPVLSKRAIKEIGKFERKRLSDFYFTLDTNKQSTRPSNKQEWWQ